MGEAMTADYLTDWDWQMVDIVRERVRQTFPTAEEGRLLRFADALLAARAELAQHAALVAAARKVCRDHEKERWIINDSDLINVARRVDARRHVEALRDALEDVLHDD